MTPAARLFASSLGGIYLLKILALANRPRPAGLPCFLLAWPGIVPDTFGHRQPAQTIAPAPFLAAWARMIAGLTSIVLLAIYAPIIPDRILGLAGIAALLVALHLGICDLLPWLLRWVGFPVPLLFDRPWAAATLGDFWGRRWNLAFVEMNRRYLLRPLYRRLGKQGSRFALFALSGVVHELALSFPAGGGWGFPMTYFLLQGALVAIEDRFHIVNRAWVWFWLLAPSPWLFHEPFRRALVVPLYRGLHEVIARNTPDWYRSHALYAALAGHFIVLIASFQAPARLGWKQDVQKLTRFNQKVFWVYAGYVLFCIVSFAVLTWTLHDEFVAGDPTARCLAVFMALFWTIRVLVDIFWYDHRDWPAGNSLLAGHALVTTLFTALATVYWCIAFSRST